MEASKDLSRHLILQAFNNVISMLMTIYDIMVRGRACHDLPETSFDEI